MSRTSLPLRLCQHRGSVSFGVRSHVCRTQGWGLGLGQGSTRDNLGQLSWDTC